MKNPTVLLVDDEPDVLEGLALSLHGRPYRVVLANGAATALEILATESIDVVISDERMPDMQGSELLSRIYARSPDVVRIILTGQATLQDAARAVNSARVFRYLQKPCSRIDLLTALSEAFREREAKSRAPGLSARELGALTPRELEVLELVAEGQRIAQIARTLHVSNHTARNHIKALFRKLGAHSQAELMNRARGVTGPLK